ncbi:hypothetical protein ACFY2K_04035 [Kitasatospora sp. NPDC001309]|uniref:hypothetical protein n=1 Tax=Kitasatospora sp. NPDC001309 TaxID=3364013 RepID=UPI003675897C
MIIPDAISWSAARGGFVSWEVTVSLGAAVASLTAVCVAVGAVTKPWDGVVLGGFIAAASRTRLVYRRVRLL